MNMVLIFDVAGIDIEFVKKQLSINGYHSSWTSGDKRYYLPQNCMWKNDVALNEPMQDIQEALRTLREKHVCTPKLLRCICLPCTPWQGIAGINFYADNESGSIVAENNLSAVATLSDVVEGQKEILEELRVISKKLGYNH